MSKERNSNIELFRIICMLMVMILHFNGRCINPGEMWNLSGALTGRLAIGHLFEALCIMAVDGFVLISGYFGINFKWKGLLKLFLQCFFWGLMGYVVYCLATDTTIAISTLAARAMAFTHNHWWFVDCYIYLMFTAPILNAAVNHLDKIAYRRVMVLFSIVLFYFGFCRDIVAEGGMSYVQFVYLYMLGRYLNKHVSIEDIQARKKLWLLGYLGCALVIFGLALLNQYKLHLGIYVLRPYPYCSPLVIAEAVCLLLSFLSLNFKSSFVNKYASSVFAGYLFQESSYFGIMFLYPTLAAFCAEQSTWLLYLLLVPTAILFLTVVVGIDQLQQRFFSKPVLKLYDGVCERITANGALDNTPPSIRRWFGKKE